MLRKLFLLRKIFLSKTSMRHYSQYGEDDSTYVHLLPIKNGFFVDVGCYHPKKYNNTYRWYRKGWRGVNIDLDPVKIEAFNMVRPGDVNLVCAISKEGKGELRDCYSFGRYSVISTMDKAFAEYQRGLGKEYVVRQVRVASLDHMLDQTRFAGRKIDLLTVDVEGFDLDVLQSLSFERYSPLLILVELHEPTIGKVMASPLYEFMVGKGYDLVNWTGPTLVFKRKAD
ncbi:MAG: FkbM family methyltransferase [Gallionellaceae bacterium]|nr:MAG: FkbM family methyltransferase [Gallionellaceae bacterium]